MPSKKLGSKITNKTEMSTKASKCQNFIAIKVIENNRSHLKPTKQTIYMTKQKGIKKMAAAAYNQGPNKVISMQINQGNMQNPTQGKSAHSIKTISPNKNVKQIKQKALTTKQLQLVRQNKIRQWI